MFEYYVCVYILLALFSKYHYIHQSPSTMKNEQIQRTNYHQYLHLPACSLANTCQHSLNWGLNEPPYAIRKAASCQPASQFCVSSGQRSGGQVWRTVTQPCVAPQRFAGFSDCRHPGGVGCVAFDVASTVHYYGYTCAVVRVSAKAGEEALDKATSKAPSSASDLSSDPECFLNNLPSPPTRCHIDVHSHTHKRHRSFCSSVPYLLTSTAPWIEDAATCTRSVCLWDSPRTTSTSFCRIRHLTSVYSREAQSHRVNDLKNAASRFKT